MTETEIRVMTPACQGMPKATRNWKRQDRILSQRFGKDHDTANTLVLDIKPPELWWIWDLESLNNKPRVSQLKTNRARICSTSVQFSSVTQLRPHELQHTRPPYPSPTAGVYQNLCLLSRWCHPTISSSVILFSSCLQPFPASGSSNESALRIRWPKYWSFSFSISPSNEHPGLISFRMDWLDLLAVQGTLESLLQHHSSKASILQHSAFFIVQLSHPYMTTGKTIALTRWTFVDKLIHIKWSTKAIQLSWSQGVVLNSFNPGYISEEPRTNRWEFPRTASKYEQKPLGNSVFSTFRKHHTAKLTKVFSQK